MPVMTAKRRMVYSRCYLEGCSNKPVRFRRLCREHLDTKDERDLAKARVNAKADRDRSRAKGLCQQGGCRRKVSARSKALCATHLAQNRENVKALYARRRAQGLCRCCGRKSPDRVLCARCRARAKAAREARG